MLHTSARLHDLSGKSNASVQWLLIIIESKLGQKHFKSMLPALDYFSFYNDLDC